jgi:thymidylate synthase (FAD)
MKTNGQILVELQESMGSDRSIANSAWTSSFDKEKRDARTDEQVTEIVKRLCKEGHSVPFESVEFRFWIRMPIFTDRQHVTHRIASHNGLSGRYRTMPKDYFELPNDVMKILQKVNDDISCNLIEDYYESCEIATNNYSHAISILKESEFSNIISNKEYKRVREILRGQLPTAGMTERTSKMNLRSFANYQKLRNSEHAQSEIKQVAELMLKLVEEANICPVAIQALKEKNWII